MNTPRGARVHVARLKNGESVVIKGAKIERFARILRVANRGRLGRNTPLQEDRK